MKSIPANALTPNAETLNNNKKVRQSGIELLRIILMLQVIFLHVCDYGKYSDIARNHLGSADSLIYWFAFFCSRCPVYVYIVILGYFSVTSNKTISQLKSKVPRTYLPMLFYAITIPFLGYLCGITVLKTEDIVKAFLPVLSRTWYFMTLYLLVLILSPFINKCLTNLTKKEYTILISVLFFIFSIWTLLDGISPINKVIKLDKIVSDEAGKSLYGFIYMYILGGYLRLHIKSYDKAKFRFLFAFFALAAVNVFLVYLVPKYRGVSSYNDNPISVIQGACLVLFFRDLKFKSRIINSVAVLNLGVYMIHEHPVIRNFIWKKVFNTYELQFYSSYTYILKIIAICLAVYVVCAVIEQIRVWLSAGVKHIIGQNKRKRENNIT